MPRIRINGRIWFAMDASGVWWWYSRKPRMADGFWTLSGGGSVAQVPTGLIVLPPCERRDWRKSLFKANGERDDGRLRRTVVGTQKSATRAG